MNHIYNFLIIAIPIFVWVKGDFETKIAAFSLLLLSVVTWIIFIFAGNKWGEFSLLSLMNECVLAVIFFTLAIRSKRFWPLPLAAFQIPAVLVQLAPLFGENLASYAIGVGLGAWSYLQMIVIILAVIRGRNRAQREAMKSPYSKA